MSTQCVDNLKTVKSCFAFLYITLINQNRLV
nr:MAG TPA: hypothetical protein [Caudoviricetes sp.]